jgi:hypothetical protein
LPFPTARKDPDLRAKWIKLVNRQSKHGTNWEPCDDSRICSKHFEPGNPVPTLHLGYELKSSIKVSILRERERCDKMHYMHKIV